MPSVTQVRRKRGRPRKNPVVTEVAKVAARKICILGYAEETRDLVHNLNADYEIWGINAAHYFTHKTDSDGAIVGRTKARPTNWFQIHPADWSSQKGEVTGYFGRPKEHMDFLKTFDGTVWLQAEHPDLPNAKVFPLQDIATASGRLYITSTFAFQLALAWYQHHVLKQPIAEIVVYGVNLSSIDEYIHQKSCVEYWLGRLEQAGVSITVPAGSALLKGKLYAIGDKKDDLSDHAFERLQYWKSKYVEAWANVNTALSMKTETQFWADTLGKISVQFSEQFTEEVKMAIQEAISKRVGSLQGLADKAGADMNGALGVVKDNQHWLSMTGGIDHHAPKLPELRVPSPQLATDFETPLGLSI